MTKVAYTIGTLLMGGAERFVVNLIKNIDHSKFDVILIVLDKKRNTILEAELENANIDVYYLNKPEGFSFRTMIKMARTLRKFKPDVIHGNIGGILYVLLYLVFNKNVQVIHTAHTLASREFGKFKRIILRWFYLRKRIIPVVITSGNTGEFLDVYKIPSEYVEVIENGIDLKRFVETKKFLVDEIRLGHIGRFEEVKNHQMLVSIYKELSFDFLVSLKLIGKGSLLGYYRELLIDENVEFVLETNEIEEELKEIDFFVFPSLYEGMPLSVLEAMASGCIIIASNVGGLNTLIEDGVNGYKFAANDLDSFVGAIKDLIIDREKLEVISKNNIKKARKYSLESMVDKYEKLYSKEINKC